MITVIKSGQFKTVFILKNVLDFLALFLLIPISNMDTT